MILNKFFSKKEISKKAEQEISSMLERFSLEKFSFGIDENGLPFLEKNGQRIITCTKVEVNSTKKEVSIHYPFTKTQGQGIGSLFYLQIAKYYQENFGLRLVSRSFRFDKGTNLWRNLLSKKLASYDPERNIFLFQDMSFFKKEEVKKKNEIPKMGFREKILSLLKN